MNEIKMFGHRVLLEKYKPAGEGKIVIPDSAGEADSHRLGKVRVVGDGHDRINDKHYDTLVKEGQIVMFQVDDTMAFNLTWRDEKDLLLVHMHQGDLIARINGSVVTNESFEVLGDFILLRWELQHDSPIILPDSSKQKATHTPDMFKFYVEQKGSTVDYPLEIGDEVICLNGRMNVIFIEDPIQGRLERAYILKQHVCGMVPKKAASEETA